MKTRRVSTDPENRTTLPEEGHPSAFQMVGLARLLGPEEGDDDNGGGDVQKDQDSEKNTSNG